MKTGLYLQIEDRGMDQPLIARIRTKDTVYSWSAFFSRRDAEAWARNEYTRIKIQELERLSLAYNAEDASY